MASLPPPRISPPAPPAPTAPASNIRPSFDCSKARSGVERLVCANNDLAVMDVRVAALYAQVLPKVADPNEMRGEQQDWLARRNDCVNAGCLATAYKSRIAELQRWIEP